MATVSEPKSEKEPKPQLVPPASSEPELFAAEIEMERKSHNFLPVLLALVLAALIAGVIYYVWKTAHNVLLPAEATTSISNILKTQAPATVTFSTGVVHPNGGPQDPAYKLLSKAGVVVTKGKKGAATLTVTLTGPGENLLNNITGVKKVKDSDNTTTYTVRLAERKLLSIDKITMVKPRVAQVAYTWKWEPNRLGKDFDAAGSLVQSFSNWDRQTLIQSYGVDFYNAAPSKAGIVLMQEDNGTWTRYRD
jgi:hypothetical protein